MFVGFTTTAPLRSRPPPLRPRPPFPSFVTGYVNDLKLVTLFQDDQVVEKLLFFFEAMAPSVDGWDISDAEAFVVQTVGDVVTEGLAEDTVRHMVTAGHRICRGDSVSTSVKVPPMQGPELCHQCQIEVSRSTVLSRSQRQSLKKQTPRCCRNLTG